jgi:hypothetical protein
MGGRKNYRIILTAKIVSFALTKNGCKIYLKYKLGFIVALQAAI